MTMSNCTLSHCENEPGWCALRRGGGVIYWYGPYSLIQQWARAERLGDLAGQLCR